MALQTIFFLFCFLVAGVRGQSQASEFPRTPQSARGETIAVSSRCGLKIHESSSKGLDVNCDPDPASFPNGPAKLPGLPLSAACPNLLCLGILPNKMR